MTTAELGKIFLERGIKLNELPESEFDCLVGEGSGGAVLFGTTGGVMEAALRTVYEQVCAAALSLCASGPLCWTAAISRSSSSSRLETSNEHDSVCVHASLPCFPNTLASRRT